MIAPAFLDELRARVPVSEVVGSRVKLRKAGREWKGLSPFNKERTPSFFVNDQKGFYHDFSSGKHGDVFAFMMETEGVTFPEAVERIAAMAGATLSAAGAAADRDAAPRKPSPDEIANKVDRLRLARQLWVRSRPAQGTIAETYLRARGYRGAIPATLRYLPASGIYPPALIAAYGMAVELSAERDHQRRWEAERGLPLPQPAPDDPKARPWVPGPWIRDSSLHIADADVMGVHLIKLRPDGSDRLREDKAKITIGVDFAAPIVLAPPNDLLGLAIAEGIEDALIAHQETGLGAWAAGGAGRLPMLADHLPSHIECVTILVDDNEAGRINSIELANRIQTRFGRTEVLMTPTGADL